MSSKRNQHIAIFFAGLLALFLFESSTAYADCTNPARVEGSIIYNSAQNVPQVCAGSSWIALGVLNPAAGGGSCTSPNRTEGAIVYNIDFNVLQYCDGTNWIAVQAAPSSGELISPAGCANIGDQCADLTIFAGWHPVTQTQLFVHPNNQSAGIAWSTESVVTGATSDSDGKANHDWIVANKTITLYPAFKLCDDLNIASALGHTDWYLPSRVELYYFWTHRAAINAGPGAAFQASNYWSSSELNLFKAWYQVLSWGIQSNTFKTDSLDVRCLRRN